MLLIRERKKASRLVERVDVSVHEPDPCPTDGDRRAVVTDRRDGTIGLGYEA